MPIKYIKKRDGQIVPFDLVRIQSAIKKAIVSSRAQVAEDFVMKLSELVIETTNQKFNLPDTIPGVEDIQDIIEMKLAESGNFSIAKAYILYREEHKKQRVAESLTNLEKFEKNLLTVTKHNGTREAFSRIKLENFWNIIAREYIQICPFNEIFEKFKTTLVNEVSTVQLLKNLRKSALDLVTVKNINWQLMAGRLYSVELYKAAMRTRGLKQNEIYTPLAWKNHFDNYIAKKLYSTKMRETYTDAEIIEAGSWINTDRDFEYGYSTLLAFYKRYLLNPNKIIHELPQEMYLAVSLFLAMPELPNDRLRVARAIYEATSTQKLSLATPTLLNARTNFHQLSSCFKMNVEDDLRSIFHSVENMAQISKFGGGVGVYLGHIRSKGGSIRGVKNTSGGIVPWARVINDTACAVNQLGSRMGAISITLDIWHKDIHDFLDLQTETGDMRSKAFDIFPAISVPDIFMERAEAGLDWTLFDPQEVEKLFGKRLEDHFCDEFKKFYLQCENDPRLELKKTVNARDVLKKVLKTTVETGMPYFFFRDTVNKTNPNKHAGNIYSTQLCTEICQNASASRFISETLENGEAIIRYKAGDTVVCNLASINIARVHSNEDINNTIAIAMRVLDNVITLNFYPIKEAELTAMKYRSVGLGFMGLAEHLACNKLAYDTLEAREYVDGLFEKYAFSVLKHSNALAIERGAYSVFKGSAWEKGEFFGRNKDWFANNSKTDLPWQELFASIQKHGVRFAYHMAPAPNTSTAGVTGTTAGVLPIYKKFFVETNVFSPTINVAPNLNASNFWYYKEYINMDMKDVIDMIAVLYKWIDQSISFEWLLNPVKTSPAELYEWYMRAWKANIKTIYYLRSMSAEVADDCISCSG